MLFRPCRYNIRFVAMVFELELALADGTVSLSHEFRSSMRGSRCVSVNLLSKSSCFRYGHLAPESTVCSAEGRRLHA